MTDVRICPDDTVAAMKIVSSVAGACDANNAWIVEMIEHELAKARAGLKHNDPNVRIIR